MAVKEMTALRNQKTMRQRGMMILIHVLTQRERRTVCRAKCVMRWANNTHQAHRNDMRLDNQTLHDSEVERKQSLWLTQKKLALTTFNIHYKWALSRMISGAVSEWRFNRYKGKLGSLLGIRDQYSDAQRIIDQVPTYSL